VGGEIREGSLGNFEGSTKAKNGRGRNWSELFVTRRGGDSYSTKY